MLSTCPNPALNPSLLFSFFLFRSQMVGQGSAQSDISFVRILLKSAAFSIATFPACFAELCTIPLDTAKVRLQLQKNAVAGEGFPKYRGLLGTLGTIAKEEGFSAMWKGAVPGFHRQFLMLGLKFGMYDHVKRFYIGKDGVRDVPPWKMVLAGLTTGALTVAIVNPTDLVKVRLQAEGKLPAGAPRRYTGALNAYSTIVRQEGVAALWTGIGPNIARISIMYGAQLAAYDLVKQAVLKSPGFTDGAVTHSLAGLGAGLFSVCIGSPVDVVKTRMMMGDSAAYKSTRDCFVKTLKNEGPSAFYKGFIPSLLRVGSRNVIMFVTLEQTKKVVRNLMHETRFTHTSVHWNLSSDRSQK